MGLEGLGTPYHKTVRLKGFGYFCKCGFSLGFTFGI